MFSEYSKGNGNVTSKAKYYFILDFTMGPFGLIHETKLRKALTPLCVCVCVSVCCCLKDNYFPKLL